MQSRLILLFILLLLLGCTTASDKEPSVAGTTVPLQLPKQPNIVWLVAEDLGMYIPSFGDSTIQTPTLSRLAAEGVRYTSVFSQSPVCAPSRFGIATGMYPNHLGGMHMRTGPWFSPNISDEQIDRAAKGMPEGIEPYEPILPTDVKMMSEYLRAQGYYCTNNSKEDYQFRRTLTAWDESSRQAHWRNREDGQPFFAIFNFEVTHESRIWSKANDSLWVDPDLEFEVPPYLPDNEVGRTDIRRMYSNIREMDHQIGQMIAQLEADGLLENTIIVWYTDHGGPLPRQKRLLYDSGLHVPMIIRFPGAQQAGTIDDQLISFIDFAPTTLSLVGIQPPDYMDGQAFLGPYAASTPRSYIHAHADRFDESYDMNRAVRDKRYKYIRYFQPEKPMFLPIQYREQMPIMRELHRLKEAGELTEAQALWFRETKPKEELFDTRADPHEIHNLAEDPQYAEKLAELRAECERWMEEIDDKGLLPEKELVQSFWPGKVQPVTDSPKIALDNGQISLSCSTPGASIGYKIFNGSEEPASWTLYTGPFSLPANATLKVVAQRIGYQRAETVLENI